MKDDFFLTNLALLGILQANAIDIASRLTQQKSSTSTLDNAGG